MNRYDPYITEYLTANKEVALEKIGILRIPGYQDPDAMTSSISFVCDRKTSTSPGLIDFITESTGKLRSLIESDLESHFSQVREFLNIGKAYEISNAGFIKLTSRGEYEFMPYPQTGKVHKVHSQPEKNQRRRNNRSVIQFFTLLIVIAIVAGLGWEVYQFYIRPKTQQPEQNTGTTESTDSTVSAAHVDSLATPTVTYSPDDTVTVRYVFETTDLLLRAKTRTAQLRSFGNTAGYDSTTNGGRKLYSLFLYQKTRIADTLRVKDSIQKFLQRNIQVQIPKQ